MKILFVVILALILLWIVFIGGPAVSFYVATFCRKKPVANLKNDPEKAYFAGHEDEYRKLHEKFLHIPKERISLTTRDNVKLYADYCNNGGQKMAVLLHGYRSDIDVNLAAIGVLLTEKGYDLLLPYCRGHAPSGGSVSMGILEQEDLIEWVNLAKKNYHPDKLIAGGISMGAATVAYASDRLQGVDALIIDCGFSSPYEQLYDSCKGMHLPAGMLMPVMRICGFIHLKKDIKKSVTDSLRNTDIPAFFIHGKEDRTVSIKAGIKNYKACRSRKEFVEVPDAPHTSGLVFGGDEARQKLLSFIEED